MYNSELNERHCAINETRKSQLYCVDALSMLEYKLLGPLQIQACNVTLMIDDEFDEKGEYFLNFA